MQIDDDLIYAAEADLDLSSLADERWREVLPRDLPVPTSLRHQRGSENLPRFRSGEFAIGVLMEGLVEERRMASHQREQRRRASHLMSRTTNLRPVSP